MVLRGLLSVVVDAAAITLIVIIALRFLFGAPRHTNARHAPAAVTPTPLGRLHVAPLLGRQPHRVSELIEKHRPSGRDARTSKNAPSPSVTSQPAA